LTQVLYSPRINNVGGNSCTDRGIIMKASISGLLTGAAIIIGAFTHTSARADLASIIASYTAMDENEVFTKLKTLGVGACSVGSGASCPTCACNFYFKTGLSANGYTGAPRYNTDNYMTSAYAGSSTGSRWSGSSPAQVQYSTGCFAGAGGMKGSSNSFWQGNNQNEGGLSSAAYAKLILLRLMADSADPCKMSEVVAASTPSSIITESAAANPALFRFEDRGGMVNPKRCAKVVTSAGSSTPVATPMGHVSPTACATIYRRIVAGGGTPITTSAGNTGTVLYANDPIYLSQLESARTAILNSYALSNPEAFNPLAVQPANCTPASCQKLQTIKSISPMPSLSASDFLQTASSRQQ